MDAIEILEELRERYSKKLDAQKKSFNLAGTIVIQSKKLAIQEALVAVRAQKLASEKR